MSVRGKFSRLALLALALFTAALPFAGPDECAEALDAAIKLCGGPLLLSLFPFLIVSLLLIRCGAEQTLGFFMRPVARLVGVRAPCAGGVLLVGLLGGFAPAANAVAESVRSGKLTAKDAAALLPACVCSGPSFVIVTVGGQMLGSAALGVRLYISQLLACWLTAALLRRLSGAGAAAEPLQEQAYAIDPPSLDLIIADSALTYVKLSGFVIYFRFLSAGIAALLPPKLAFLPAVLLEVSSGCDLAAQTGLFASVLCCAALSWQGLSVLLQVRTICPKEVSLRPLLAARVLHLPASLALLCLTLPPRAQETFNTLCDRVVAMRRVPVDCALLVLLVCCMLACELCRTAESALAGRRGL